MLNHKFAPNLEYIDTVRDIPNTIFTNDQSWPEHETVQPKKTINTYRIFYVGDSTTHGTVNEGKRMPDIVEKELNTIYRPRDLNIEVINTRTSSYSTALYYLLIKNELLKYDPDLIVINVDMTDVRDDSLYRTLAKFDEGELPVAVRPSDEKQRGRYQMTPQGIVKIPLHQRVNAFAVKNSLIIRSLEQAALRILGTKKSEPDSTVLNTPGDWLKMEWNLTVQENTNFSMKILFETVKLLRDNGIRIMITGVPHHPQYTGKWSVKPHEVLAETAQELNVPYLNSYETLKEKISNTPVTEYYWRNDLTHFNEKGNAIWVKAQLDFLLDPRNSLTPPLVD